jgi:hypothetical protein
MIKPTVGRVVHFRLAPSASNGAMQIYDKDAPLCALVTYVWSDTCVNLIVFDHAGSGHPRTSVPINNTAGAGWWAEWMPYQIGQAAKTEALEAKIAQG